MYYVERFNVNLSDVLMNPTESPASSSDMYVFSRQSVLSVALVVMVVAATKFGLKAKAKD